MLDFRDGNGNKGHIYGHSFHDQVESDKMPMPGGDFGPLGWAFGLVFKIFGWMFKIAFWMIIKAIGFVFHGIAMIFRYVVDKHMMSHTTVQVHNHPDDYDRMHLNH